MEYRQEHHFGFEGGPVGVPAPTGEKKQILDAGKAAEERLLEASKRLRENPDDSAAAEKIRRNQEIKARLEREN